MQWLLSPHEPAQAHGLRTRVFDGRHTLLELSSLTVDTGRLVEQLDRQSSSRRRTSGGTELRQRLVAARNGKHVDAVFTPRLGFGAGVPNLGDFACACTRIEISAVCSARLDAALGSKLHLGTYC